MSRLGIKVLGGTQDSLYEYSNSPCVQIYSIPLRLSTESRVRLVNLLLLGREHLYVVHVGPSIAVEGWCVKALLGEGQFPASTR